jgi:hypothetical protein
MMPENGASMGDAARTRENENKCICDGCDNEPEECGMSMSDCDAIAEGNRVDAAYEAWRDEQ